MANWHAKKMFGWPNERENGKPKYSWIAKTNSDGTQKFFLFHTLPFISFISFALIQTVLLSLLLLLLLLLIFIIVIIIVVVFNLGLK